VASVSLIGQLLAQKALTLGKADLRVVLYTVWS